MVTVETLQIWLAALSTVVAILGFNWLMLSSVKKDFAGLRADLKGEIKRLEGKIDTNTDRIIDLYSRIGPAVTIPAVAREQRESAAV
jgi:hypothetical protein